MSDAELFDASPYVVADPDEGLSDDARRTRRIERTLTAGKHPLTGLPLHPDAPPALDRAAPGPRCGTCAHLTGLGHHGRAYLKCDLLTVTHGPGTDARAWWPACQSWEAT